MPRSLTPEELEAYKRGAREREARRRRAEEQRREQGWVVARRAARLLRDDFNATQVLVFGSLAHGAWFRLDSDIDIAAEGIAPEAFWRAWSALDEISGEFEIDLVANESATPALRRLIEEEGISV